MRAEGQATEGLGVGDAGTWGHHKDSGCGLSKMGALGGLKQRGGMLGPSSCCSWRGAAGDLRGDQLGPAGQWGWGASRLSVHLKVEPLGLAAGSGSVEAVRES